MAITPAQFMRERPEFESAGTALVATTIATAQLRVSADEYGDATDAAVSLLTAHLLWTSPFGASLRLDGGNDEESSRYLVELRRLRLERIPRIAVL